MQYVRYTKWIKNKLQNFVTNIEFFDKNVTRQNQNKHKNPCQSPESDALTLDHRIN